MNKKAKHIGIVGVSVEGAALCYRAIVAAAGKKLGDYVHPEITLHHYPFYEILEKQRKGDWDAVANILTDSVYKLAESGAKCAVIPANSVHFAIDRVKKSANIPVISILDVVADYCVKKKYKKVGVLGVGMTMSGGLYKKTLESVGIGYAVPGKEDQDMVNGIIYSELVKNIIRNQSTQKILSVIARLKNKGCEAVILGCTELPLVISDINSVLPVIDSTYLLSISALDFALK